MTRAVRAFSSFAHTLHPCVCYPHVQFGGLRILSGGLTLGRFTALQSVMGIVTHDFNALEAAYVGLRQVRTLIRIHAFAEVIEFTPPSPAHATCPQAALRSRRFYALRDRTPAIRVTVDLRPSARAAAIASAEGGTGAVPDSCALSSLPPPTPRVAPHDDDSDGAALDSLRRRRRAASPAAAATVAAPAVATLSVRRSPSRRSPLSVSADAVAADDGAALPAPLRARTAAASSTAAILRFEGVSFAYGASELPPRQLAGAAAAAGDRGRVAPRSPRPRVAAGTGLPMAPRLVLDDVSFETAPGRIIAIVGPSGGGKSTIARLALRFFDPIRGAVTLGGEDLRTLDTAVLRRRVALVDQDPTLLDRSVRDNVALGSEPVPLARVIAACRLARAHEFISALPQGYDTPVGERGGRLSGGQAQRVRIARAILRDPEVLVLDEATSSLDAESEAAVSTGAWVRGS